MEATGKIPIIDETGSTAVAILKKMFWRSKYELLEITDQLQMNSRCNTFRRMKFSTNKSRFDGPSEKLRSIRFCRGNSVDD